MQGFSVRNGYRRNFPLLLQKTTDYFPFKFSSEMLKTPKGISRNIPGRLVRVKGMVLFTAAFPIPVHVSVRSGSITGNIAILTGHQESNLIFLPLKHCPRVLLVLPIGLWRVSFDVEWRLPRQGRRGECVYSAFSQ